MDFVECPATSIFASATRCLEVISRSPLIVTMSPGFTCTRGSFAAPCTRQCTPAVSSMKKKSSPARSNVTMPVMFVMAADAARRSP